MVATEDERECEEERQLVTPPGGVVSVTLEGVAARMSHLNVLGAGAQPDVSPKTQQKGTLQKHQLFASAERRTALPPWSLSEPDCQHWFRSFSFIPKAIPGHLGVMMIAFGTELESLCRDVVSGTDFCRTGEFL